MRRFLRTTTGFVAVFCSAGLCSAAGLLIHPQKDTIQVLAEGPVRGSNFALVFDRSRVGISGWYNLDDDPDMTRNLAPTGSTSSDTLFHTLSEVLLDGKKVSIGPGPASNMSLVESQPERVVIRFSGPLVKLDSLRPSDQSPKVIPMNTGRVIVGDQLPDYELLYTVYPSGAVYVHLAWDIHGPAITLAAHHAVLATAPSQEFAALNDLDDQKRAFTWPATFLLHHGAGPTIRSDVLLSVHFDRFPTDWLGQLSSSSARQTGWFRSAFNLLPSTQELPQGHFAWDFLLNLEPGSAGQRAPVFDISEDYRHPAVLKVLDERWGTANLLDPGDANSDGFSERDGAYNLVAGPRGVRFSISAETYPRFYPVFRVSNWQSAVPDAVLMDENVLSRGKDFNAFVKDNVLVFQYLGVIRDRQARFEFPRSRRP